MCYYVLIVLICLFALIIHDIAVLRQFQDNSEPKVLRPLMSNYLKREAMKILADSSGIPLAVKIRSPTRIQECSHIPIPDILSKGCGVN